MSTEHNITLPVPPLNNRYYRKARNITYLSKEGRDYKATVAAELHGMTPLAGPVCLSARVYRARNVGDVDAYLKGLLDACQGFLYEDDKQITALHVYKDLDRKSPRVELRVWEAEA